MDATLEFYGTKQYLVCVACSVCKESYAATGPFSAPHGAYSTCKCGAVFTSYMRCAPFPESKPTPYEYPSHIGHA